MNLYILETLQTNNFTDLQSHAKIAKAWDAVTSSEQKPDGPLFGVYTDYRSDFKGDYAFGVATLEARDHALMIPISDNMNYRKFTVENGDVARAWQSIWEMETQGLLHRAYTVDFEKYDASGISIYIAVEDL